MKPVKGRLGPAVERFLGQVQQIDSLRAELEEFEHFEAAAVPRLQDSIATSRVAIRDAQRTLREIRGERRRRDRQLIRLRRTCGLERTARPSPTGRDGAPEPETDLAAGREALRRLARWREALATKSKRTHASLRTSQSTAQRSYELLRETRAPQDGRAAAEPIALRRPPFD